MLMKLRLVLVPAPISPPMKSIVVVELAGRLAAGPLREQRGDQLRQTVLAFRIERAAGAHDHPHADDRLLVVEDHHDLQPVGERLERNRAERARPARSAVAAALRTASASAPRRGTRRARG